MTDKTPVTRNTALSLPHALSAKLEPIATMNVTQVVDKGNFKLVPMVINMEARTKLTAARTTSKATSVGASWAFSLKRQSIQLTIRAGISPDNELLVV